MFYRLATHKFIPGISKGDLKTIHTEGLLTSGLPTLVAFEAIAREPPDQKFEEWGEIDTLVVS